MAIAGNMIQQACIFYMAAAYGDAGQNVRSERDHLHPDSSLPNPLMLKFGVLHLSALNFEILSKYLYRNYHMSNAVCLQFFCRTVKKKMTFNAIILIAYVNINIHADGKDVVNACLHAGFKEYEVIKVRGYVSEIKNQRYKTFDMKIGNI
jgi:hypothetical protein